MATEVSLCSNAMLRLGAEPISSLAEGDVTGANLARVRLAANLLPTVRQAVLRAHPWNCATKRAVLSPDVDAPAFGFAHAFALPGDWLRTLQVGDEGDPLDYRAEGRLLLSDAAELPLVYVADNPVPATWDTLLVEAVELALAAAMAYPVTKSPQVAQEFSALYQAKLREARNVDGQDNPPADFGDHPLIAARTRFG